MSGSSAKASKRPPDVTGTSSALNCASAALLSIVSAHTAAKSSSLLAKYAYRRSLLALRLSGDPVDPGPGEPVLGELSSGRGQDPFAGCLSCCAHAPSYLPNHMVRINLQHSLQIRLFM